MSHSASNIEAQSPSANTPKRKITRRQLFRRILGYAVVPGIGGVYATQVEPFWPEFHEQTVNVPGLPKSFDGMRIAHLTDLHAGRVPMSYLETIVSRVKELKPDIVAVTGDLVHHNIAWVDAVSNLLGTLNLPTYVSFGNHDYGVFRGDDEPYAAELPDKLEAALVANNCKVLRNAHTTIDHDDGQLWIVGMDDLWFGNFSTPRAFAKVPKDATILALTHNPDTAEQVARHNPALILSGHTHGGQVRLPFIGALYLNTFNTKLDKGRFQLKNSVLYVSAGIGYIHRIRFYCRPEVPIFKLVRV